MGCFDSVMIPCPKCGNMEEAQSKSGDNLLKTYYLCKAPANVLYGVNRHAPFTCTKCGTMFRVTYDLVTRPVNQKTVIVYPDDEETEDATE